MSEQEIVWIKMWRLNRSTGDPEQVAVAPLANPSYVLVSGEDHTSYKGGFFATPELAFKAEEEEAQRSIRYANERLERVARARKRFETQGGK